MKDAAEMKFQNSDASGVRTNSVTEKKSYTSITCFNELVASDSYKLPVDNLLHLIEEIKIFGYLKQYGEASSEDLCSIGIKKPSSVISRLCKLGLPVVTSYATYYFDKDGNRKFASCLYSVDRRIFSTKKSSCRVNGGFYDEK